MKRKPIVNKGWDKNLNVIESIAADVFEPKKKTTLRSILARFQALSNAQLAQGRTNYCLVVLRVVESRLC